MKLLFSILIGLAIISPSYGQETVGTHRKHAKHEVKIGINSGLMAFKGSNTNNYTTLWKDFNQQDFWKNSPYGDQGAIILGASLNYKRISSNNWIFTLDAGYEFLRNKVVIDSIVDAQSGQRSAASGHSKMSFNFLNFNPMLGYRINLPIISIDLQAGVDFAYLLSAEEKRDVRDAFGNIYQGITHNKPISMDVRPRAQINVNFPRTSWYIGYSEGVMNYLNDARQEEQKARSSMLRAGVQLSLF